MFDRLDELVERHRALTEDLAKPGLSAKDIQRIAKERAQLDPIVICHQSATEKRAEREDNKELLAEDDPDLRAMAKEEISRLDEEISAIEEELRVHLLPKDPNDDKNIVLEIRGGTGGDEASIFAGELFNMYSRYGQANGWKIDIVTSSEGTRGGFKEIIATISGNAVYSFLKYEAGVHRVQRVPATESQGRIHTSACTVAVMPEAEDIDMKIDNKDLRIDVFRASGPGGQSVNTTDSAVRITHLPTGMIVICQDEKSQLKNKTKAMSVLRARLYDRQLAAQQAERAEERRGMVGSGDRSEKIRTYNFPQDRCTDHRISLTMHNLAKLFSGELDPLVNALRSAMQAELLSEAEG